MVSNASRAGFASAASSASSTSAASTTITTPPYGIWRGAEGVPLAPGSSWRLQPRPERAISSQQAATMLDAPLAPSALTLSPHAATSSMASAAAPPMSEYMPCVAVTTRAPSALGQLAACPPLLHALLTNLTLRHPSPYRRTRPSAALTLEFAVSFERLATRKNARAEHEQAERQQRRGEQGEGGVTPAAEYAVVLSAHNEATALRATLRPLLQLTVGAWELA